MNQHLRPRVEDDNGVSICKSGRLQLAQRKSNMVDASELGLYDFRKT